MFMHKSIYLAVVSLYAYWWIEDIVCKKPLVISLTNAYNLYSSSYLQI